VSAILRPAPRRPAVSLLVEFWKWRRYVLSASRIPGRLSRSFVLAALRVLHLDRRASVRACPTIPRVVQVTSVPRGPEASSPVSLLARGNGRVVTKPTWLLDEIVTGAMTFRSQQCGWPLGQPRAALACAPTYSQRARREVEWTSVRDCYDDPQCVGVSPAAPAHRPASSPPRCDATYPVVPVTNLTARVRVHPRSSDRHSGGSAKSRNGRRGFLTLGHPVDG
jgi:hypothetical protein